MLLTADCHSPRKTQTRTADKKQNVSSVKQRVLAVEPVCPAADDDDLI